ncbi:MAG: hypothetical protein IJ838_06830 [Paludibacteraceae bacterium]|nr:hypothetical protein [Paludibacteraceae bacterium]
MLSTAESQKIRVAITGSVGMGYAARAGKGIERRYKDLYPDLSLLFCHRPIGGARSVRV